MAMFEVKDGKDIYTPNNVAGKFGTNTGASFVGAVCPAGTLCVQNGLIPSEGYEAFNILNGNTWYFNAATSGAVAGKTGDHTGIFAFNGYDVNKVSDGSNTYNIGAKTLGLSLPAGERGDFTELVVGQQYKWDIGNFTTTPAVGQFATIASANAGKWTPASSAPAAGGVVYAQILRTEPINEGVRFKGDGYIVRILRAVQASA